MAEAKVILVRQRLLLVGLGRGRTDLSYEPGRTVLPAYERYAEERSGHFFLRDQSTLQYYESDPVDPFFASFFYLER